MQDLIVVKQLPQIEEHLKELSLEVEQKVENAKSLVCTEENVTTIKQIRASLNKEFKEVENQRKIVKEQILAPYMQFEEIYKMYISDKYKSADNDLKEKIDSTENELKNIKEQEIKDYFEEYKKANNIDFVTYSQARINVTLSASRKSLKEQAKQFIDKIVDDLKLIDTQEHKTEILVEYKHSLNVSQAITSVTNRFKAIEEEKKRQEELKRKQLEEAQRRADESIRVQTEATRQALENFIPKSEEKVVHIEMDKNHEITQKGYEQLENVFNKPLEKPREEKQEEILTLRFTVRGTRTKLRELKQFLENGGYDYE
jgi:predicted amino acid-binding ACT domain protein